MIIRITIPTIPNKPHFTKKPSFTPEIKIIVIKVATITMPVPKSGSNIMRAKKVIMTARIGNTPCQILLISLSFFSKYFAVKIINASFAASLG